MTETEVFAVVLVGQEEGDVQLALVRATSPDLAISAALHDPRWETYACPVALDADRLESVLESIRAGRADLCAQG